MWLSLCVCLGARAQVHGAGGGGLTLCLLIRGSFQM